MLWTPALQKQEWRRLLCQLRVLSDQTSLLEMDRYLQHGDTTCLWHSVAVAYVSLWLDRRLRLHCRQGCLLVGALLHDYFLYDWHQYDPVRGPFHGFYHPGRALANAVRDYPIGPVERDIIARHMFPLTPIPPCCREAAVVCLADKLCSAVETLSLDPYARLRSRCIGALAARWVRR